MTGQVQARDRELTAARLLDSSARNSFDPDVDIDWSADLDPDLPYAVFQRLSLYGTPMWERMTHRQRVELSKHELASVAGTGLWFELILLQMMARYAYDRDPQSAHVQYALTEIGDETRHSLMFAKMTKKLGTPAYRPSRFIHEAGRVFKATSCGPSMFASTLVAEEVLDRLQRESMDDAGIQPLVRMVNRIHVIEEARHVRFAREELVRQLRKMPRALRAVHQHTTAVASWAIMTNLVHPRAYAAVGLDPRAARKAAASNPIHRESRLWMGEKVMAFLGEVGMVSRRDRIWWRRAGLMR